MSKHDRITIILYCIINGQNVIKSMTLKNFITYQCQNCKLIIKAHSNVQTRISYSEKIEKRIKTKAVFYPITSVQYVFEIYQI